MARNYRFGQRGAYRCFLPPAELELQYVAPQMHNFQNAGGTARAEWCTGRSPSLGIMGGRAAILRLSSTLTAMGVQMCSSSWSSKRGDHACLGLLPYFSCTEILLRIFFYSCFKMELHVWLFHGFSRVISGENMYLVTYLNTYSINSSI